MQTAQLKVLSNDNGTLTLNIAGRIDTNNANDVEKEIDTLLSNNTFDKLILDLTGLNYLSSVGIRILMRMVKSNPGFEIINTSNEVYDILEMTGITTIIPISKQLREVSIDGLEKIGAGFNGAVYRLDDETIIKVLNESIPPDIVKQEHDVAQKAFLLGVPSAISFDVVKVGDHYGIVYEMLSDESYLSRIQNNPDKIYELGKEFGRLGHQINRIVLDDDSFGSIKDQKLSDLEAVKDRMSEENYELCKEVLLTIPEGNNFIHGDFHPGNVLVQDDEPLLIDFATSGKGHPILEILSFALPSIGSVYNMPDSNVSIYNNLNRPQNYELYDGFLEGYFDNNDTEFLNKVKDQIMLYILAIKAIRLFKYIPEKSEPESTPTTEDRRNEIKSLGADYIINEIDSTLKDLKKLYNNVDELAFT